MGMKVRLNGRKRFKKDTSTNFRVANIAPRVEEIFKNTAQSNRILVLSAHTNDPQMLAIQAKALKKYLKFDYDFIVGIDLPPIDSKWNLFKEIGFKKFEEVALLHSIKLLEIPGAIHLDRSYIFPNGNPASKKPDFAKRCADTFQFMLGIIPWQQYSTVLYLDADMFPISPIQEIPTSYLVSVAGVKQIRKKWLREYIYFWPGLVWLDARSPMRNLLSFDLISRFSLKTDVGGETNSWIRFLTSFGYEARFLRHLQSGTWDETNAPESVLNNPELLEWLKNDYRNVNNLFFAEIYDEKFLHYRGGGNWMLNEPHNETANRDGLSTALRL